MMKAKTTLIEAIEQELAQPVVFIGGLVLFWTAALAVAAAVL